MGLLDDAIREHLELKRAHGADAEAVKRELDDALGPARRDISQPETAVPPLEPETAEPEPVEPGTSDAARGDFDVEIEEFMGQAGDPPATEPPEHPRPAVPDRAESWGGSSVFADELRAAEAGAAEPVEVDAAPAGEAELAAPPTNETDLDPDLDPAHDELPPESAAPGGTRSGDTPPRGFEAVEGDEGGPFGADEPLADEADGKAEEGGDHDVLEETPEFLQETPEHDRLWFEQKPPRDFDFDEE